MKRRWVTADPSPLFGLIVHSRHYTPWGARIAARGRYRVMTVPDLEAANAALDAHARAHPEHLRQTIDEETALLDARRSDPRWRY